MDTYTPLELWGLVYPNTPIIEYDTKLAVWAEHVANGIIPLDISYIRLSDEDLPGANLLFADLNNSVFENVDFSQANLQFANLEFGVLINCDFTGTKLQHAQLDDTEFSIDFLKSQVWDTVYREEESVVFKNKGFIATLYHEQECCEDFWLEDINGDLSDLTNTEILVAEERTSNFETESTGHSETWTFYTLRTMKGTVTLRFCGSSNGYYSESADFKVEPNHEESP